MMTTGPRTLGAVNDSTRRVDERLAALMGELRGREFPMTVEEVGAFVRAAYGQAYTDALSDSKSMTEEVPMLLYYELFMP